MKARKKMRKTYIEKWEIKGDTVELTYNDGEVVNVSYRYCIDSGCSRRCDS